VWLKRSDLRGTELAQLEAADIEFEDLLERGEHILEIRNEPTGEPKTDLADYRDIARICPKCGERINTKIDRADVFDVLLSEPNSWRSGRLRSFHADHLRLVLTPKRPSPWLSSLRWELRGHVHMKRNRKVPAREGGLEWGMRASTT